MSSQEFWCQTRGKKTHCADGVGFPDPREYGTWIDFRSLYSKPYPEQDATGSLAYRFTTKLFGALKVVFRWVYEDKGTTFSNYTYCCWTDNCHSKFLSFLIQLPGLCLRDSLSDDSNRANLSTTIEKKNLNSVCAKFEMGRKSC